jgi:alkylation response protein AidB-like acyl-CoA dehydrogenase
MRSAATATGAPPESADLNAYRLRCRDWLAANLTALADVDLDEAESLSSLEEAKRVQALLFDGGFAGISWPTDYGGQGLTMTHQRIFNEEVADYFIPTQVFVIGLGMCAPTLLEFGTEEHKKQHIPRMLRGDEVWCQLFSEPGAGSDVASLQTRAARDGDEWIVNGQKVWTSGAHISDYGIMIARTDPDAPKHRGISMFILDMHSPGVAIRPLVQMTGHAGFNEVFFDDVRIPADRLLGEVNNGWRAAIGTLMNERVSIGAGGGGTGRRVGGGEFRRLVALARRSGLVDQARVRELLAGIYCDSRVLELLSDRIRASVRAGKAPGPEGSIAKLATTELAQRSADTGFEIVGLRGQAWDAGDDDAEQIALAVLAYPGNSIAGGTTEIMKNILGERVLGLPKEPQVDRDIPFRELRVNTAR